MVVKPLDFILRGKRGLAQPAVKCRCREYLRIIYGPDYTADENISRLRQRGLGHKRSLALGEFALGVEGLERFVRREPLRQVHECIFGVLALEERTRGPEVVGWLILWCYGSAVSVLFTDSRSSSGLQPQSPERP